MQLESDIFEGYWESTVSKTSYLVEYRRRAKGERQAAWMTGWTMMLLTKVERNVKFSWGREED